MSLNQNDNEVAEILLKRESLSTEQKAIESQIRSLEKRYKNLQINLKQGHDALNQNIGAINAFDDLIAILENKAR